MQSAYHEHLVRDVGALFLALIIVHAGHLDGYDTVDKVGLIGSLVTVPVLALIVLWAGWAEHSTMNR